MTNLDIDRRLALAIGYAPEDVQVSPGGTRVFVRRGVHWSIFGHQYEHTIYPIAEKFKMMPCHTGNSWRVFLYLKKQGVSFVEHTDPRTCIALAVIEAADRGLLK